MFSDKNAKLSYQSSSNCNYNSAFNEFDNYASDNPINNENTLSNV